MDSKKLQDILKTSMLTGTLTLGLMATDLTPKSWQAHASDETKKEKSSDEGATEETKDKGSMASCGEGS